MSQGWMRVREAAHLMGVSQTTVRRRMEAEELRSRVGRSGRQEVFLPVKLRRELEAKLAEPCPPGHLERGKTEEQDDGAASQVKPNGQPVEAGASDDAEQATEGSSGETPNVSPGIDLVRRYERLAGGSLILAQQHSDEVHKHKDTAFEQLAHTRSQLRQVRRVAFVGWASCAAAVALGLVFSVSFGVGMARAQAEAKASRALASQAVQSADRDHHDRDANIERDRASALSPAETVVLKPARGSATVDPAGVTSQPRVPGAGFTTASVPTE